MVGAGDAAASRDRRFAESALECERGWTELPRRVEVEETEFAEDRSFSPKKPNLLDAWLCSPAFCSWDPAGEAALTPGRGVSSPWLSERRVRSGVRMWNVLS